MKRTLFPSILILAILSFSPLAAEAKTRVYMLDGEEIDAVSAWRAGDTVYVLRNRDILLEFPVDQVDLSRSRITAGKAPVARKPQGESAEEAPQIISGAALPTSLRALFEDFKAAHANKDLTAMSKLVYWEGVDERTRQSLEDSFASLLPRKIGKIERTEISKEMPLTYTVDGTTYRPNLKPSGLMRITIKSEDDVEDPRTAISFLIGRKGGVYYIVTAAPKK